ncbi:MAG: hypothetical protein ACI8ZM_003487 [Crocinitomix sp.]|jgi:hypothetical protein
MKNSKVLKVILFISGLLLTIIGGAILFMPIEFFARSGVVLDNDVSLLNNVRSSGGIVMASGILILLGSFVKRLAFTSTVISTLIFLSWGISRAIAMAIDGIPADALIKATIVEIVIGLVGAFALAKYRNKETKNV